MKILTNPAFVAVNRTHPWSMAFDALTYRDGDVSFVPKNLFATWLGTVPNFGKFYIGRNSSLGVGSLVKYDTEAQSLRLGNFVAGGSQIYIVLNGQHNMDTISTYMLEVSGVQAGLPVGQYPDTVIGNDVWLGDKVIILGGSHITDGCIVGAGSVIPPGKHLEPYGIYAGNPAKLIRFRFPDTVMELLRASQWWNKPLPWINQHKKFFSFDINADAGRAIERLTEFSALAKAWDLANPNGVPSLAQYVDIAGPASAPKTLKFF